MLLAHLLISCVRAALLSTLSVLLLPCLLIRLGIPLVRRRGRAVLSLPCRATGVSAIAAAAPEAAAPGATAGTAEGM